ncbi:MAG: RHS repeat domain-containing protein [Bacteroidales bacterium]
MLVNSNGVETLYYGYYDYQGSLLALTDANGIVVEKYAYDPWGKRRNPDDWTQKDTRTSWLNNRGYTGHEHLDAFGIINMNGRVYDPLTAMFLSPDPYVQAPDNWLNYNRYSYAFGNPFKYTDPSGELFDPITLSIILNGAIAVAMGAASAYVQGNSGNAWGNAFSGFVKSAISYGAQQMIPSGVGDLFKHKVGSVGHEIMRAGIHGLGKGLLNSFDGGDFGEGFAVGALGSLGGSIAGGAKAGDEMIRFASGLGGATGAALTGGDPMSLYGGFMSGYSIGELNHTGDIVYDANGNAMRDAKGNVIVLNSEDAIAMGYKSSLKSTGFNIGKAVFALNSNAQPKSIHRCAAFVRKALDAGGINTNPHPVPAADYDQYLLKWGFVDISNFDYNNTAGDVAVFDRIKGHPYGHIEMYNGTQWVSDYKQNSFWAGSGYSKANSYRIYRWGGR